jgi:mono/diheme cytochrome c family protein
MLAAAVLAAQSAFAADADSGKRLAHQHCSSCHIVEPGSRRELANSPPFETIAQKFADAPELIAFGHTVPAPKDEFDALSPGCPGYCGIYRYAGQITSLSKDVAATRRDN